MFATYREKIGINRDINSDHLLRVLEVNAQRHRPSQEEAMGQGSRRINIKDLSKTFRGD